MNAPSLYVLAFHRKRRSTGLIMTALYLYFLGRSFRSNAKGIGSICRIEKHGYSIQLNFILNEQDLSFMVYETMSQIVSDCFRLFQIVSDCFRLFQTIYGWVDAVKEPIYKQVLVVYISRHTNILVVELFLRT